MPLKRLCLLSLFLPSIAWSQSNAATTIPSELAALIEKPDALLAEAAADLNGDGLIDYVFIVQKPENPDIDTEFAHGDRTLKIALRMPDNSLNVVKVIDKVVLCTHCGGVFGDPFEALTASQKTFTVSHYGGSNWRWANAYRFGYSRIDKTWQLLRIEEHNFHTSNPEKMTSKVRTPPKDFGKIDIADFDPDSLFESGKN